MLEGTFPSLFPPTMFETCDVKTTLWTRNIWKHIMPRYQHLLYCKHSTSTIQFICCDQEVYIECMMAVQQDDCMWLVENFYLIGCGAAYENRTFRYTG